MQPMLIVSFYATLLTIGFAVLVLIEWCPNFKRMATRKWSQSDLLILGVLLGFVSVVGDNVYWGITWYSKMKNWSTSEWWFEFGPVSNLIFRHAMKIAAAACHLEAARRAEVVATDSLVMKTLIVLFVSVLLFSLLV